MNELSEHPMVSVEVLRQCRVFEQLSLAALTELSSIGTEVTVKAGDWLFHEADPADALYLIIAGQVSLNLATRDKRGTSFEFGTRTTGEILGWSAVVGPHFYSLGARAVTDTKVVKFGGEQLLAFIQNNPEPGNLVMQGITQVASLRMQLIRARLGQLTPHK